MQPNRPYEPGFAGVGLTYARLPLELDPAGYAGADVVILGAPFDEGVSYRPGTRFGPRRSVRPRMSAHRRSARTWSSASTRTASSR